MWQPTAQPRLARSAFAVAAWSPPRWPSRMFTATCYPTSATERSSSPRTTARPGHWSRHDPASRCPRCFSGHLGFGEWGPPPDGATPTIAVGLGRAALDELFASVAPAARIDNDVGLDTEERGRTVWICREQRRPWSQAWRQLRHIG